MRQIYLKTVILLASIVFIPGISVKSQDTLFIKGAVLTTANEPVPNVSVNIEGSTALPVVTDESGNFSLASESGDVWLVVYPTGDYKRKRIFLNNREEITIHLTSSDLASGNDQFSVLSQQFRSRNMISSYSSTASR